MILWFTLVGALTVLGCTVAAVAWGIRSVVKARHAANQVVPGVPTRAPAHWAGSHDPEARLHRRLREAVLALRTATGIHTDTAALELRVELQEYALALDDALVDTAALPPAARAAPLAEVTAGIQGLEDAAAVIATRSATESVARLRGTVEAARAHQQLVEEARREIDDASRRGASPTGTPYPQTEPPAARTEPPAPQAEQPAARTEPPEATTDPPS